MSFNLPSRNYNRAADGLHELFPAAEWKVKSKDPANIKFISTPLDEKTSNACLSKFNSHPEFFTAKKIKANPEESGSDDSPRFKVILKITEPTQAEIMARMQTISGQGKSFPQDIMEEHFKSQEKLREGVDEIDDLPDPRKEVNFNAKKKQVDEPHSPLNLRKEVNFNPKSKKIE